MYLSFLPIKPLGLIIEARDRKTVFTSFCFCIFQYLTRYRVEKK